MRKASESFQKSFQSVFKKTKTPTGLSIDSRSTQPGDVFVAIKGDQFDGHDFIDQAFRKGAIMALCEKSKIQTIEKSLHGNIVFVDKCIEALRDWAVDYRQRLSTQIVAVAGSNGKTTTKELTAHIFEGFYGQENIFKTAKSENSILGTALSLLRIRNEKFAIIEIGIDELGWMRKHLELVKPHAGVITTIQEEHLAGLGDIETVAKEELKLLDFLKESNGVFAANLDSPWIRLESLPELSLTYGLKKKADLEASYLKPNTLHLFGYPMEVPLPGEHNAQNLLAAIAIYRSLHPSLGRDEIQKMNEHMKNFKGEAHRSQWITTPESIRLFDDCYNANPSSMEAAIETFAEIAEGQSMIAVLGDMLELGKASQDAHRRIINLACLKEFSSILLFGTEFKKAFESLSMQDKRVSHYREFNDLQEKLKSLKKSHQCVLLKGSRGMALEKLLPVWTKDSV